jgi:hypothetical protein
MMSPKELDAQSPVKIDEWLDIDGERCKELDPDRKNTKFFMKIGFEDKFLFTDISGRIWGRGSDNYYPFHFNIGKKLYGFRIAKKAAN